MAVRRVNPEVRPDRQQDGERGLEAVMEQDSDDQEGEECEDLGNGRRKRVETFGNGERHTCDGVRRRTHRHEHGEAGRHERLEGNPRVVGVVGIPAVVLVDDAGAGEDVLEELSDASKRPATNIS